MPRRCCSTLSKTAPSEKYQVRAYARLHSSGATILPARTSKRAEMCQAALDASSRPAEQQLVLAVLEKYPSRRGAGSRHEANASAGDQGACHASCAGDPAKAGRQGRRRAGDCLSKIGLDPMKVEIVKAEYGAGGKQKDVTETLQKQVRDVPLIHFAFAQLQRQLRRRSGAGHAQAFESPVSDQRQAGRSHHFPKTRSSCFRCRSSRYRALPAVASMRASALGQLNDKRHASRADSHAPLG